LLLVAVPLFITYKSAGKRCELFGDVLIASIVCRKWSVMSGNTGGNPLQTPHLSDVETSVTAADVADIVNNMVNTNSP